MSVQKQLFDRFQEIKTKVQALGGIVQNEGFKPSDEHLQEFTEQADAAIDDLIKTKTAVLAHFTEGVHLLGEWDNDKNCFRFGANEVVYIAYKSSNQVFVYAGDNESGPPFQTIQHTRNINTLRDFTNAIQTGTVYQTAYTPLIMY